MAQDWRHSIFLTGRAARKEDHFASESPKNQRLLLAAMAREWKTWEEHKATLPLTQSELRMLKYRFPNLKLVGTHWVLTPKKPDFMTRLEVHGCLEDPSMMRTGLPQTVVTVVSWSFLGQHRNMGVVVLLTPLLHHCKQEKTEALVHDAIATATTRM